MPLRLRRAGGGAERRRRQAAPEGGHAFAAGQAGLPGDLGAAEPPHFVKQSLQPFVMPRDQMETARHFGARPLHQFQVELVEARQFAVQLRPAGLLDFGVAPGERAAGWGSDVGRSGGDLQVRKRGCQKYWPATRLS